MTSGLALRGPAPLLTLVTLLSCGTPSLERDPSPDASAPILCLGSPTDLQSDPYHCGSCDHACFATEVCSAGTCTCPEGRSLCVTQCRDLSTDVATCGSCDVACKPSERCESGVCCGAGKLVCGGKCVDPQTTFLHCGACGSACPEHEICSGGACVACPEGQIGCGGKCTVLATDADNCGVCGRACKPGFKGGEAYCALGRCVEQMSNDYEQVVEAAVAGPELVYTADGLRKRPKAGGSSLLLAQDAWASPGFALDGGQVYFTQYSAKLFRVPVAGGLPVLLCDALQTQSHIALGGGYVYSQRDRVSVLGGAAQEVVSWMDYLGPPLTADAGYIYYGNSSGVTRIPHAAPTGPERVVTGNFSVVPPAALVTGGIVGVGWPGVYRGDFGGGVQTLVSDARPPIVVLADVVYFGRAPGFPSAMQPIDRILRIPAGGGVAEMVVENLPPVSTFTVDAAGVYLFVKPNGPMPNRRGYWRVTPL